MGHRSLASLTRFGAGAAIAALALVGTAHVEGQTPAAGEKPTQEPTTASKAAAWTAPKTPWGHPDLQGVWNNASDTPLTAGRSDALFTEDDSNRRNGTEVQPYNSFWGDSGLRKDVRPFLLVDPPDGKIPPLTPEAKTREAERLAARSQRGDADSYLDRNRWERCLARGLPMAPGPYNNNYQILQTPGYVVILMEMIHDTRIIPLDGRPHLSSNIRSWLGDSRGRWEGNTLVVDTININDKMDGGQYMPSHGGAMFTHRGSGETLHVVERFTRVGPDIINYEFTMDDPKTYTRPWTVAVPMVSNGEQVYEYACHEGNYGIVQILKGARFQETQRKAATTGEK